MEGKKMTRADKIAKKYQNSELMPVTRRGPGGPGGGPGFRGGSGGKPKNTRKTISRLMSYISRDKGKMILAFVCIVISSAASLAGSYMLKPIIDQYIVPVDGSPGSVSGLASALVLMGVVYVLSVAATYFQSRLIIGVSQRAIQKLRDDLYVRVQKLPVRFYDTHNHGDVMSRFTNDMDTVGEMLNNSVTQLFSGGISIIGTLALMLYTNVLLAVIVVVMVPLMVLAGGAIAKRGGKYFSQQQKALGAVNGYIEETISGQKVVKVFCHEDQAVDEFEYLNNDLKKKQILAQFTGGMVGPVMGNLGQLNYALIATAGGVLCALGSFTIGSLTVFTNYSRQFSRPINELSQQMSTIFSALAGAERVFAIMDEEPEEEDKPGAAALENAKGHVKLNNVTFGYKPDAVVLKNISLEALPGKKIAFVGSTGAGKTTITNLLNRFYDIQQGQIIIDGRDVRDYTKDSLRANIAMVLQDTHLFTGTVRENIRYGRLDATDEEVEAAAKTASAHSFIMRLPEGYDTMLEGDGSNLSQGQRQLLNIARAAISKAAVLVLDEATSSVDTRTERHIEHGMERLMKNRTTFVIAHRLSTVRNADTILVLERGEIIERGNHEALLKQQGRYYSLHTGAAELD